MDKCLIVCRECGDLLVPFSSTTEREHWATWHCQATDHTLVRFEGWPSPHEVATVLTSYP